tara:strand:+ start:288 stop:491 length:204 start_codon:yes stop_codon:yes gene_type:complete
MKKEILSLKKVGYLEKIPSNHHISEYEEIIMTKNGKSKKYYRKKSKKKKYNEITNFNVAIERYNEYL